MSPMRKTTKVFALIAVIATQADADPDVRCERIMPDLHNRNETISINGEVGVFSYNSNSGQREEIPLLCASYEHRETDAFLCSRVIQRENSYTVDNYVLPGVGSIIWLQVSRFVENAHSIYDDQQHVGSYEEIPVSCY